MTTVLIITAFLVVFGMPLGLALFIATQPPEGQSPWGPEDES